MTPEQTIAALSKELHLGFFQHGVQLFTTVSKEQLETLATRIAEQAIAEHLAKQIASVTPTHNDDWIIHTGGVCPIESGTPIEVRFRNGTERETTSDRVSWGHCHDDEDVVAYLVRTAKQQESAPVLPELPEPDGYVAIVDGGSAIIPPRDFAKHNAYAIFTADQMREYALAAIAAGGAK